VGKPSGNDEGDDQKEGGGVCQKTCLNRVFCLGGEGWVDNVIAKHGGGGHKVRIGRVAIVGKGGGGCEVVTKKMNTTSEKKGDFVNVIVFLWSKRGGSGVLRSISNE